MLISKTLHILDVAQEVVLGGRSYGVSICWGCGAKIGDDSGMPKHRRTGGRDVSVRVFPRSSLRLRGAVCHSCALDIRVQYT